MFLIGIVVLILVFVSVYGLYVFSKPVEKSRETILAEQIRDSAVMMLAQPRFSGKEFSAQILEKGEMHGFDWKKKEGYFSYPQTDQQEFDEYLNEHFADQAKIEMGTDIRGKIKLDDYTLTVSPEYFYFFKSSLENIKVDADETLNFPFKNVDYTLSLDELRNFANNSQVYGGKLIAETLRRKEDPLIVFANHGIMVAKPNEPSLQRLTNELLKDEAIGNDREKKIQKLVDFVSNEIEYSYTEAVGRSETLKRANEVLMTRTADCSNKTILLASLLEQIGEEYILLYSPQHITVAVPQGNFPNENKLDFEWNGKPWMIAETTLPDFQIGKTRVQEFTKLATVEYVQVPRQTDIIFDAHSYNLLKFY
jgi:hypothetical protein